MSKCVTFALLTVSVAEIALAQAGEIKRHVTGAQCWSNSSATFHQESSFILRDSLTEGLLVTHLFRIWFLAQVMPAGGHAIEFSADGTFSSKVFGVAKRWQLHEDSLAFLDEDGREWFRFRYSEGCGTLVHEYEYASTPQVLEIGIVN